MSRTIDLCTCGRSREAHGTYDVEQHYFFPNPQPEARPPVPFGKKLQDFLESQGEIKFTNSGFLLKQLDGTVWEVQAFLRKDPAANSGGV